MKLNLKMVSVIVTLLALLGPVGFAIASNTIKVSQLEQDMKACRINTANIAAIKSDINWIKEALRKVLR